MESALKGKIFISTRPKGKASELHQLLCTHNAIHTELPLIELHETTNYKEVNDVIANMETFNFIAFTSANAFTFFLKKIAQHTHALAALKKINIASIGYKTSETIRNNGFTVSFDAHSKTGEEFALKMDQMLKGKYVKILWPTGNLSPNKMQNTMQNASITRLNIYQTTMPKTIDKHILNQIKSNHYDMIICASPSALSNLVTVCDKKNLRLACIGNITATEALKHKINPLCVAKEPNALGIFNALNEYYKNQK